jgi:hypothetical protein
MKKKIPLAALMLCCSVQAEEITSSGGIDFYAGVAFVGSWTSSDFKMDYTIDKYNFRDTKPWANHKENSIGRVGMGLTAGIKKRFENDWFIGGELNYIMSKAKHHHNFLESDDIEFKGIENTDRVISYAEIRHGDEWALSLKFGKNYKSYDVYGIFGTTTKQVEIKYGLDGTNIWVVGEPFEINPKKRVWGAVFGLGGSKKINDRISCFLEYRYKVYNSAKKSVDCRDLTEEAFNGIHDTSERNFKVKSDKHELSLGVVFHV